VKDPSPIIHHDAFLKPIVEQQKSYWQRLREHIKHLESNLVVHKKLELLDEFRKKLLQSRDHFVEGLKKKFTITVPRVSKHGITFEKKEFNLF
jgi:hypothetical protein